MKGALHKLSDGTPPSEIGIDLDKVLAARSDWSPVDDGDRLRGSVGQLYSEHFALEPPEQYAYLLENTLLISDWIAAPLGSVQERVGAKPSPA